MYNYNKLRGRIKERFGSQTAFADAVGDTQSSISAKMRAQSGLSSETIYKWSKALDIEPENINTYFFSEMFQ